MIETKKIELKYYPGPIFHHLNEVEELLEEYGMGELIVEDNKAYFIYREGDDIEEYLQESFGEPLIRDNGDKVYFCGFWVPGTFDILWKPEEKVGYIYDFKFKTVKDFRLFQREFFKYKRQSKKNIQGQKELGKGWEFYIVSNALKFALTYCDYTDEEKEIIKKYWEI